MSIFTELPEIEQRTYAKNTHAFACLTNMPITPGHTLIIPSREVAILAELSDAELQAIRDLVVQVQTVLAKNLALKVLTVPGIKARNTANQCRTFTSMLYRAHQVTQGSYTTNLVNFCTALASERPHPKLNWQISH